MLVRNVGSWAGLNFSHNDGDVLELPDGVATARIEAGRAVALTDDEIAAGGFSATRPSPDIHPDHVPGADHGGVRSVANPNHRPGMPFVEAHAQDVENDVKARKRRGKAAQAADTGMPGSPGTLNPPAPSPATLEPGSGTVTATTGAGRVDGIESDTGSGHTASAGDAATADAKAAVADAGPDVTLPDHPAASEG